MGNYTLERFSSSIRFKVLLLAIVSILTANGYSTVYYVSSNGSDYNSGTSSSNPWKTLLKVSNTNFSAGDQILFKRGESFHGTLNISKSGSYGNHIVYGAYGTGEKPIFTGLRSLTNWSAVGGGIYRAPITTFSDVNLLLINGEQQKVGRFPNTGLLNYESISGTSSIYDEQLSSSPNWTGAEVVIKKNGWTIDRNKITSHSGGTINYETATTNIPRIGSYYGYFIQRDKKTLDQFGEWFYDGQYMYVYFGNNNPNNYTVETTDVANIISLNYVGYVTIENLNVIGSNLYSLFANIYAGITLRNCEFNNAGTDGVFIKGRGTNLKVENNLILNTQGYALNIGSSGTLNGALVSNNVVKKAGLTMGMGGVKSSYGAMFVKGLNSLVEYNVVEESGYNGISYYSNGTVVRYNYVKYFNSLIHDGGGIYTWKLDPTYSSGMKVYNNIVIGGIDGNGIYSDGISDNLEIYNNTIANLNAGFGILLNQSRNNYVHNNNIFNNSEFQIGVHNLDHSIKASNCKILENNIITTTEYPTAIRLWDDQNTDIFNFGITNNNYFIARTNNDGLFYSRTNNPWHPIEYNYDEWKGKGYDTNSKITFTDSDYFFRYNATKSDMLINLPYPMTDAKGIKYSGTINLAPFSSVVLIKDPEGGVVSNLNPVINDQTINVNAPAVAGQYLGKVVASAPESDQSLSYKIINGNEDNNLWLSSTTGNLYTTQSYNSIDNISTVIKIEVTDNGNPILSSSANISIVHQSTDTNNPPIISNQQFEVESMIPGGLIGTIFAEDNDSEQSITFEIVSGNEDQRYWLSSTSGRLFSSQTFDPTIPLDDVLEVKVSDNGSPVKASSALITIAQSSSSRANIPPVITDQNFEIESATQGALIGQVVAYDENTDQSINYSILSGNENGNYWISSTSGRLYLSQTYDESKNASAQLIVQVEDNGNPKLSNNAAVSVVHNLPNNTAPAIQEQTFNIEGNIEPGALIGQIMASDTDENQSLVYSIISEGSDQKFWLSSSSGRLYTLGNYNSRDNLSSQIVVEVKDNGTPQMSSSANVFIVHTQNTLPIIEDQEIEVSQVAPGDLLGTVRASDPDIGQSLQFEIIEGDLNNQFWIAPSSGNLYTIRSYEIGSDLTSELLIKVTDDGVPPNYSTAVISINHLMNTAPVIITEQINISGDYNGGDYLGNVAASDNENHALSYEIVGGTNSNQFWISPSNGNLYTIVAYSSSLNLSTTLTVKVTDKGTPAKSSTKTIDINHVQTKSSQLGDGDLNLSADKLSQSPLTMTLFPNPFKDKISFEIENACSETLLQIVNMEGKVLINKKYGSSRGWIKDQLILDYLENGSYILSITSDNGTVRRKLMKF